MIHRRNVLGAMGLGTAALAVTGAARAQHEEHKHGHGDHLEVMARCARACAEAASHCLGELRRQSGNSEKHADALAHTAACEQFCTLSASQAACGSPLASIAHEANARACDACAKACEGMDDQVMKDCIESCRECAEVCRAMARHAGHGDRPQSPQGPAGGRP